MKWISILCLAVLVSACGFNNQEVIEYQQVVVTPNCDPVGCSRVSDPGVPVDVTITNIDYY